MEIRALKEVQQIIHRGKTKGFVTLDEVNQLLPADAIGGDQIDEVMALLGELEIELVDNASPVIDEADAGLDEEPLMVAESGEVAEATVAVSAPASLVDPVRYYFHEMGRIPLLGRAGEVELARRMEEGSTRVRNEAFASPLALVYVLDLAARIDAGEVDLAAVVSDDEEADVGDGVLAERAAHFRLGVERIRRLASVPVRDRTSRLDAERVETMTALGLGRRGGPTVSGGAAAARGALRGDGARAGALR